MLLAADADAPYSVTFFAYFAHAYAILRHAIADYAYLSHVMAHTLLFSP